MLGVLCSVVCVCVQLSFVGGRCLVLSGVELYLVGWCMGLVDGYGCAENTNPPVLCLSIGLLENRKSSDLVYKKCMDVCVVMVWCICACTCD